MQTHVMPRFSLSALSKQSLQEWQKSVGCYVVIGEYLAGMCITLPVFVCRPCRGSGPARSSLNETEIPKLVTSELLL